MTEQAFNSWQEFLNPEIMRPRLVSVSVYITAFEVLKESIIERIRSFYTPWPGEQVRSPDYEQQVLSRNKSPLHASLDWLVSRSVVDPQDLAMFERIKLCRNKLAHELPNFLFGAGLPADFQECFAGMLDLIRKIEVWWIVNFELAISSEFDNRDVDEEDIIPGPVLTIQLLMQVALGNDQESRAYYDYFRNARETLGQEKPAVDPTEPVE